MTNEKTCTSGHVIDAGKDVCVRCGASEPKSEQVEPTPISQDEIIEEETELDKAKEAEEIPLTEEEENDTI